MIDYNPRPFAAQARALCPETNHDDVWFCTTCWMLEQRLTPIHMVPGMAGLLAEFDLSSTIGYSWKAQSWSTMVPKATVAAWATGEDMPPNYQHARDAVIGADMARPVAGEELAKLHSSSFEKRSKQ